MKIINASVRGDNYRASCLEDQRHFSAATVAGLKREERRTMRHSLKQLLASEVFTGMDESALVVSASKSPEVGTNDIPSNVLRLFTVPAGYQSTRQVKEVKVVRKVANIRKPIVEFLLLAA